MSGALCIDFGTSSIRAVRRLPSGRLKPLDIGRVTKSRLDDASIRSEIHIDGEVRYVRYGERALVARKDPTAPALYEASPKLWLREPELLSKPAAKNVELSREDLLAGLLAYAIRASVEADGIGEDTFRKLDLRIAHPVWPTAVKTAASEALSRLCGRARQLALAREWGTVTVGTLLEYTREQAAPYRSAVDVVEPVAAAVELLPSEENVRRICAVVDVGAGTSDLGLFASVVPDPDATMRPKLYPLGRPVSVFKAGNLVDEIVIDLLRARAPKASAAALADVRARIRGIKETLFRQGYVQELGTDLQIEDVESHPEAKAMASEIRAELEAAVRDSEQFIRQSMSLPVHAVNRLDLVMAGGGGGIAFLRKALERPLDVAGKRLPVKVGDPAQRVGVSMFGASRSRMAVSLGGASVEYDELIHEQPKLNTIKLGTI